MMQLSTSKIETKTFPSVSNYSTQVVLPISVKSNAQDPEAWFTTIEKIIQANKVNSEEERFSLLLRSLNNTEISCICDIISDTNAVNKYNKAKEILTQIYGHKQNEEANNSEKDANFPMEMPTNIKRNEINTAEEIEEIKFYNKKTHDIWQKNSPPSDIEIVVTESKTCKMVVKTKHLILNYDETKGYYLCFPLSKLIWVTIVLPFFAFIFCVVWSILYNFEETTFTHCKVWNFLPSISAAIGNHNTQYLVWVSAVTLHSGPRFLFVSIYYRYHLKLIKHQKQYLAKVACTLSVIENVSLLGLTYLSSSGSYEIHEKCFITFMASSELHMLLVCLILRYHRKSNNMDKYEIFSLRMKTRLLIVNAISFSTAGYFFLRHNKYCEPGIYTLFAFFEYIVVLSNMAFHLTALLDFKDQCITVYRKGIDVR